MMLFILSVQSYSWWE